ncbi:unnamed protein product [Clonostachys rosea f. rosea IK726]|uniref:Zn(2)-C6 fungal-type domain-containing protein n=2 Tax=Bionectria ochroleuca TaxID=29856 RepID=A0A0B7KI45_BIOOC|nr:unnamed protein product [Clonostachys rosea f. rosea IK726]
MVYYGRPSQNCLPCRRRKIRCDLNPQGCSQCRRAKLTCYGYRDMKELAFRDETHLTTQKALARHAAAQRTAAPQLSWDVLSRNAFLCLYIERYSYGFNALAPLLATSSPAGHLQVSVGAVGLAFMALQANRPDLMPLANRQYLTAIQAVREAIHSSLKSSSNGSSHFVSNETLQSVLLLDLYEKLAISHQWLGLHGSWLSHIQGALAMVHARPSTDFVDPTTCQLASRTVLALTISCGVAGIPIPDKLHAIRRDLDCHIRHAKWTFLGLLMNVIDFRAQMRSGVSRPDDILSRACDLQDQLASAERRIPRSWGPFRVDSHDILIFDRYYDVYPSHYATQVFNAFRILRLEMCGIIRNLDPCSMVSKIIAEITQDICAAVPQFILLGAKSGNTVPFSPLQILECRGILTALYQAAQITPNVHLREWIVKCLAYMADNGVKSAQDVAHCLAVTPKLDYWTVFAMIGSCGITA